MRRSSSLACLIFTLGACDPGEPAQSMDSGPVEDAGRALDGGLASGADAGSVDAASAPGLDASSADAGDPVPDAASEPGPDAASQPTPDAAAQPGPDAGPQSVPDAGQGPVSDAGPAAPADAGPGIPDGGPKGLCQPDPCNGHAASCDPQTGACTCAVGYTGTTCGQCAPGFVGYPSCVDNLCEPDPCGGHGISCNPATGACNCATGFAGDHCESCAAGYVGFPNCVDDRCLPDPCSGHSSACAPLTGACTCKVNYTGATCNQCASGYLNYPSCVDDKCDPDPCNGHATSCDVGTGTCTCAPGYAGTSCDRCAAGFVGYPSCVDDPCDPSPCDPLVSCSGTAAAVCGACPAGYEDVNGDGTDCADWDECKGENGGNTCTTAPCSNVPGTYRCETWTTLPSTPPGTYSYPVAVGRNPSTGRLYQIVGGNRVYPIAYLDPDATNWVEGAFVSNMWGACCAFGVVSPAGAPALMSYKDYEPDLNLYSEASGSWTSQLLYQYGTSWPGDHAKAIRFLGNGTAWALYTVNHEAKLVEDTYGYASSGYFVAGGNIGTTIGFASGEAVQAQIDASDRLHLVHVKGGQRIYWQLAVSAAPISEVMPAACNADGSLLRGPDGTIFYLPKASTVTICRRDASAWSVIATTKTYPTNSVHRFQAGPDGKILLLDQADAASFRMSVFDPVASSWADEPATLTTGTGKAIREIIASPDRALHVAYGGTGGATFYTIARYNGALLTP